MSFRSHLRRRARIAGATALLGAGVVLGLSTPAVLPQSAQAAPGDSSQPAIFATDGRGRYVDAIQWLQWADYSQFDGRDKPNVPVLGYNQTKDFINTRDLGEAGKLVTTCTLSNLQHLGHKPDIPEAQSKGPLVATIPGAWAGDALDNLYNVGGPGQWEDGSATWHAGLTYPNDYVNRNKMVIGLANGYAYNGEGTWDGKKWGAYETDEVPGLTPEQWTVSAQGQNATISAEGTTGDRPLAIAAGRVGLTESSSDQRAAGYTAGQWTCSETPGTIRDTSYVNRTYSSSVGATDSTGAATLTVSNLDRVSCEITNTAKPGSLAWGKRDAATGDALGGSAWALSGPEVPDGIVVTDCESGTCSAGDYEDQDPAPGRFSLTGLKWGTYSITEHAAPQGYLPSRETYTFPQIKPSALDATLAAGGAVDENGAIGNEPEKGSVTWQKVDADTDEGLAGSEWALTGPGVPAGTVVKDCEQAACAVGAYLDQDPLPGRFKLADLPWSAQAYSLVEAKAPAGYALSSAAHEFTIAADARDYAFDAPFTNQKSPVPTLPLTGGMGADAFLMGAAGLFAATVVAEIVRRRRRRRRP